ncbi:hypothetical protein [Xanthomonas bundabergensis]|uniref:hypothetical protein n=1 Tax=Xanthomonas bundabergensis TaxID=3160842 RepID=UPI003517E35C
MNFPRTQKTGRRAELAAEDLFTSWDWNVGQDHIDIGYDLCITPDYATYQGVRFLVQVKGTIVSSAQLKALVAKNRLRQYAADILPVFILRVAPNRTIYWVHAQAWALTHQDVLLGSGKGTVTFNSAQTLADREGFERYLQAVVTPLLKTKDPLSIERGDRPFNLDPRKIDHPAQKSSPIQQAKQGTEIEEPEPAAHLSFRPIRNPENIERLREAYEYGLPRSFDVSDFNIKPPENLSTLIQPLSLSGGKMTMRQNPSKQGLIFICPGSEYSVLAQELVLPVHLFSGLKGYGITNELNPSVVDVLLRLTPEGGMLKTNFNIGIKLASTKGKPLRLFNELAPLASWAEQVADEDSLHLALELDGRRVEFKPAVKSVERLLPVLQRIRSLSRLHMIARTLKSEFHILEEDIFTPEDFQDIDLVFELLRGEQKSVNLGPMEVSPINEEARGWREASGEFFCETQWALEVAGKVIGDIPVEIRMPGYVMETIPGSEKVRIVKGESGQAWLSYAKHGETRARIKRNH